MSAEKAGRVGQVVLERMKMGCTRVVAQDTLNAMKMDVAEDFVYGLFRFHMKAWTMGNRIACRTDYEHVPLTWWDAFKKEWFPRWWLARWPCRIRAIETKFEIIHICPHLPLHHHGESALAHIEFLTPPSEGGAEQW